MMQGETRRKLVAGNWKMHGRSATNAELLQELGSKVAGGAQDVDVLLIPPAIYLWQVLESALVRSGAASAGVQDVSSSQDDGAFTGEIGAAMVADAGGKYALAGHSERRAMHAESNELVAEKAKAAIAAGLVPVICVGETDAEREAGSTLAVIEAQLQATAELKGERVYAYEPVWAIGTGKTATPEQAQEVHAFIRQWMEGIDSDLASGTRVLYGGSVKANNAAELFAQKDIDGALVGGASLDAKQFSEIIEAAHKAA